VVDYSNGKYYQILNTLQDLGECPRDEESVRQAIEGLCYYRLRIVDRAKISLESSMGLFRDNPQVLIHLSAIYFSRGKYSDGLYHFDLAQSLAFSDAHGLINSLLKEDDSQHFLDELSTFGLIYPEKFSGYPGEYNMLSMQDINIDEERMKRISDNTAPVVALFRNSRLSFDLTAKKDGSYKMIIEARGTPSNLIWPHAAVSVNGIFLENIYIAHKQWMMHPVRLQLLKGDNSIEIFYRNDEESLKQGEDRNLSVRKVLIQKEGQ
jgi:hypothetical protein